MKFQTTIVVFLMMGLTSCVSLLPVNNQYEKAGTLKKGNIEMSGHVTRYDVNHFQRTELSNINYGFKLGYGISDRFDVKLKYERLDFTSNFDHSLTLADHYSLSTKFALVPGKFSAMLTLGNYSATQNAYGNIYRMQVRSISPQTMYTLTNRKNQADLTLSAKADFLYEVRPGSENNLFFSTSLGAGFSTDLDKWAIRPEIGFSTNADDARYISYGLGLQFILPTRKR